LCLNEVDATDSMEAGMMLPSGVSGNYLMIIRYDSRHEATR
jgi:hypothetical protein